VTKYCDNRGRRTKVIHSFGFIDGFTRFSFLLAIHPEAFRALLEFPLRSFIPGSGWRAGGIQKRARRSENLFLRSSHLKSAATWAVCDRRKGETDFFVALPNELK
jgi:hypothetical protein